MLDGPVAADVADAEAAITTLNAQATTLVDTEALARVLLRAESVASSKIEGLEVGGRRLLRAEAARALGDDPRDLTAEEVLGNITAMNWAVDHLSSARSITVKGISEAHRLLMAGTRLQAHGGLIRTEQNWIGGSSFNPCSAAFVPPPPDQVRPLLEDLCRFCGATDLPAVTQAALVHAQFETIHPFIDGNGRIGRALIHVVLRRRGLARRVLPPVSLVLATIAKDYVRGLDATRYAGPAGSMAERTGINTWIGIFAAACTRSVSDAMQFERRIESIYEDWQARLGRVRADSAAARLLKRLPGAPILTVQTAAELIDRSYQQTNVAIERLAGAGILERTTVGRRNRAFEAPDILDALTDLERQLASPAADTRSSPPARRVPRRRS